MAALAVTLCLGYAGVAAATGAAAAGAMAASSAGANRVDIPIAGGAVPGATGYVFVNGVGWEDARMVYCPPSIGFIEPQNVIRARVMTIENGQCDGQPVVSAQQYIDEIMGGNVAEVISVAPVIVRYGAMGIIYYRDRY